MVCRWLGVDRVFLTENAPEPGMELVGSPALETFIEDGFLQLESEPKPYAQIKAYRKCIQEQRQNYNWIAFFDMDEFLVVRECVFVSFTVTTFSLSSYKQARRFKYCHLS
jgi:hypothetical protein